VPLFFSTCILVELQCWTDLAPATLPLIHQQNFPDT